MFSYNRRCHSFSYSSSRLDPHSDYRCFLIGREKPLCIFSLLSTSLRQSSLTARGRKLYALRMASVYLETLFHLYKNPVYIGKTAGYRIDSCYVEGIRNKEFRHPRRVSHNIIDTVEIERAFCQHTRDSCRGGTEIFP